MSIGEILIWESTHALLLIPVVIALVMLVRWIRGRPVFTERDWLFMLGHPREKVLSLHLWLRFAVLWVAVVLIAFVEGYVLLPFGLIAFLSAVILTAIVVSRVAPKVARLRRGKIRVGYSMSQPACPKCFSKSVKRTTRVG